MSEQVLPAPVGFHISPSCVCVCEVCPSLLSCCLPTTLRSVNSNLSFISRKLLSLTSAYSVTVRKRHCCSLPLSSPLLTLVSLRHSVPLRAFFDRYFTLAVLNRLSNFHRTEEEWSSYQLLGLSGNRLLSDTRINYVYFRVVFLFLYSPARFQRSLFLQIIE